MMAEQPFQPSPRSTIVVVSLLIGFAVGILIGLPVFGVRQIISARFGLGSDVCALIDQAHDLGRSSPTEGLNRGSTDAQAQARVWHRLGQQVDDVAVSDPDLDGALHVWSMSIEQAADMLDDKGDEAEQDSAESAITPFPPKIVTDQANC